ncbi:MAG: hypothetical protein [brine shrimp arlivirus 6]|nr:MAG: hypothetical protein [brine shrimp arlivirus 6]UNI74102.1 MAG: hypothetical protein [brine shrimp arlivirus 6]UNI74107.1 MAG: hypothetical protein [brine shrimp arlivirus 6]UNI74112.1 MAG: hypothetical protein [brine shrimp arlivirus 6]
MTSNLQLSKVRVLTSPPSRCVDILCSINRMLTHPILGERIHLKIMGNLNGETDLQIFIDSQEACIIKNLSQYLPLDNIGNKMIPERITIESIEPVNIETLPYASNVIIFK